MMTLLRYGQKASWTLSDFPRSEWWIKTLAALRLLAGDYSEGKKNPATRAG